MNNNIYSPLLILVVLFLSEIATAQNKYSIESSEVLADDKKETLLLPEFLGGFEEEELFYALKFDVSLFEKDRVELQVIGKDLKSIGLHEFEYKFTTDGVKKKMIYLVQSKYTV
jgi:hypothetical protein